MTTTNTTSTISSNKSHRQSIVWAFYAPMCFIAAFAGLQPIGFLPADLQEIQAVLTL